MAATTTELLDLIRVLATTHPPLYWTIIAVGSDVPVPFDVEQAGIEDIKRWWALGRATSCLGCRAKLLVGPAGTEPVQLYPERHKCA